MQSSVDGSFQNCPVTQNGKELFCVTVLGGDVDRSVLVQASSRQTLDFDTVLKKNKSVSDNCTAKISLLRFNSSTQRLETKGSAELDLYVNKAGSAIKEQLHHPDTGKYTGIEVTITNVLFCDPSHGKMVQANAKRRSDILNASSFGTALGMKESRMLSKPSNFIHWYLSLMCGTAIHRTIEGQPFINAFLGSTESAVKQWWDSATTLAEKMFCQKKRSGEYSGNELDSIGMSAITLLVGPYTIPQDAIDGRNTKWASYNENGDCDKDALTAAAIYTMLRFGPNIVCRNKLGTKILNHWKDTRGAAVMCHVTASAETALGQAANADMQEPTCSIKEMGHCIWGVLPKISDELCKLRITETELVDIFEQMKTTRDKYILFGEATRPTTANPLIVAKGSSKEGWKAQFNSEFPNLKYGSPDEGGWGEIKLLDSTQYPHLMQIYTADACCYTKTSQAKFPSVCDVFSGKEGVEICPMSTLFRGESELAAYFDKDVWNNGTRFDPHKERQDIKEITLKSMLVNDIDKDARLCNPRRKTFRTNYISEQVITVGAATFGVFKRVGGDFVLPILSSQLQSQMIQDHTQFGKISHSLKTVAKDHAASLF